MKKVGVERVKVLIVSSSFGLDYNYIHDPTISFVQAASTLVYITALSIAGERLSVRLRLSLFNSLLQQDMAFFDEHKTGELVSR